MKLSEIFTAKKANSAKNVEFGFTDRFEKSTKRVLNKNGSFNVIRKNVKEGIFHKLITMSWWRFSIRILFFYTAINFIFATIFVLVDPNGIGATKDFEMNNPFAIALFFSAQTITTVGYGSLYPTSGLISFLASTEALVGLMSFAIFTGLMYGRFSRPNPGIRFSKTAIIAPFKEGWSFQFRLANEMTNNLLELEAMALLSIVVAEDDRLVRRFFPLTLENSKITYLSLNWTVVHEVNENSPLFGLTEKNFEEGNVEVITMVSAFNDTFSQQVHARMSYMWNEIEWHKKYKLPYNFNDEGVTVFDINKLDDADIFPIKM